MNWREILKQDDEKILRLSTQENIRGSGKGGQARNKTSNAVRITYGEYSALSSNSRSREANLKDSLRKLKLLIALDMNPSPDSGHAQRIYVKQDVVSDEIKRIGLKINERNREYPILLGYMVDALILFDADLKQISAATAQSVTSLSKFIKSVPKLHQVFQSIYSSRTQQ